MQRAFMCATAVAALALPQILYAAITVTTSPTLTPPPGGWVSGDDVTIEAAGLSGGGQGFTITSTEGDSIGSITVTNTASNSLITLNIESDGSLESVVRHTSSASGGEVWISACTVSKDIGSIQGNTRSGEITVSRIQSLVCHRNCFADVTALGSTISSGPSSADIYFFDLDGGNRHFYEDGYFAGNVYAASKGIGTFSVFGALGSIDGGELTFHSDGDVALLRAGFFTEVDVETPSNKTIAELRATLGGWGGDLKYESGLIIGEDPEPEPLDPPEYTEGGTLVCGRLLEMSLVKNLLSPITVTTAPYASNTWAIGGSLASSAIISLPANGLTHQIIVNEQNISGAWTPNILVGSVPIGEGYANLPNSLGFGSAGLATFTLHPEACAPPDGATVSVGSLVTPWLGEGDPPCVAHYGVVRLHHYGEVDLLDGTESENAYTVMISAAGSDDEPVEDTTGYTAREAADAAYRGRDILLFPTSESGWVLNRRYTVTLVANELRSANVQGLPSVAPYSITFTLLDGCEQMFDMNMSGGVDGDDVGEWVVSPADFNLDAIANGVDLGSMLRWIAEHPE